MDEEDIREVEIRIEPRDERLNELGATREEFERALPLALENFHDMIEGLEDLDSVPDIEDLKINLGGQEISLGDVADITFSGDPD